MVTSIVVAAIKDFTTMECVHLCREYNIIYIDGTCISDILKSSISNRSGIYTNCLYYSLTKSHIYIYT